MTAQAAKFQRATDNTGNRTENVNSQNPISDHDAPTGRRRFMQAGLMMLAPAWLAGCVNTRQFERAESVASDAVAKPQVGDSWSYRELNGYNRNIEGELRYTVEQADALWLSVELEGTSASALRGGQKELYAAPWAVMRDTVYDRQNTYNPPLPVLPSDLTPGTREFWQSMVTSDPKERARRWHVQLDVLGEERITVPAGEFDAVHVRRIVRFEHPSFFRTDSVRTEHLWYSPQVKHWVKREWRGTYRQTLRTRQPEFREDWIVWELTRFNVA